MNATAEYHSFRETGLFADLILDYLEGHPVLEGLHHGVPTLERVRSAIERRKDFSIDRELLVATLTKQYADVHSGPRTTDQIESLRQTATFTITTAHQCNLFLGPTYTILKALHAIKLADELNKAIPEHHFVPVFYLGSEDADLSELNHTYVQGTRWTWDTNQQGAVGRMKVDESLMQLIDGIDRSLAHFPHGAEWVDALRDSYSVGRTMAACSFRLLHRLFASRGLLVLQPDVPSLKSVMRSLFWKELTVSDTHLSVSRTDQRLIDRGYTAQAHARPINLFYLTEDVRGRIERRGDEWMVDQTSIRWTESQIRAELDANPERFSPNVILRGMYQESILPNLIYVGGGGELAYWLQLKGAFDHHHIPYPLLQLRASVQWIDAKSQDRLMALRLTPQDLFLPVDRILDDKLDLAAKQRVELSSMLDELDQLYERIRQQAVSSDPTLDRHVQALHTRASRRIEELQTKMKRAERRKLSTQRTQIETLQRVLFPGGGLQERRENIGYYFALYGRAYLDNLYHAMPVWDSTFVWLREGS